MKKNNIITAAYLMIGDEILSGRTKDENINFLAKELSLMGINLKEVRIVPDNEDEIILAINQLRKKYNYLFTTGGIGPTHDDITSLSIAKAFNKKIQINEEAHQILKDYYGENNVNDARLKMAMIPEGSLLLDNPVSSAPGFTIENVIVMAGVPKIMKFMFEASKSRLKGGEKTISQEITIYETESNIAKELDYLDQKFSNVSIGSYPFENGTSIVFRTIDKNDLSTITKEMVEILTSKEINYSKLK